MANQYTFEEIADLIGPVQKWPQAIFHTYMKDKYSCADRFKLCLFNFVNGFNNEVFLEYALEKGALSDQKAIDHIRWIIGVLERGQEKLNVWWSFNIVQNRWMFLNGETKYY